MKRATIIAALSLVCVGFLILATLRVPWQFQRVEKNIKKRITASQLQGWATNLMERYPTNANLVLSELRTNFPAQLLKIYHHPPNVWVYEATPGSPGYVRISWGGGIIGHTGVEIGSTNFVSGVLGARVWQPGIFFFTER